MALENFFFLKQELLGTTRDGWYKEQWNRMLIPGGREVGWGMISILY